MAYKQEVNSRTSGSAPKDSQRNQEKPRSMGDPAKSRGTALSIKFATKK